MRVKALLHEVKEEFRKYGIDADIHVFIHNLKTTKDYVQIIAKFVAKEFESEIRENSSEFLGWFEIEGGKDIDITIFFNKEEK